MKDQLLRTESLIKGFKSEANIEKNNMGGVATRSVSPIILEAYDSESIIRELSESSTISNVLKEASYLMYEFEDNTVTLSTTSTVGNVNTLTTYKKYVSPMFLDSVLEDNGNRVIVDILDEEVPFYHNALQLNGVTVDDVTISATRDIGLNFVPSPMQNDFWRTWFREAWGDHYNNFILYVYNTLRWPFINENQYLIATLFPELSDKVSTTTSDRRIRFKTSKDDLDGLNDILDEKILSVYAMLNYNPNQASFLSAWCESLYQSGLLDTSEVRREETIYRLQDLKYELLRRKFAGSSTIYDLALKAVNRQGTSNRTLPIGKFGDGTDTQFIDPRLLRLVGIPGITKNIKNASFYEDINPFEYYYNKPYSEGENFVTLGNISNLYYTSEDKIVNRNNVPTTVPFSVQEFFEGASTTKFFNGNAVEDGKTLFPSDSHSIDVKRAWAKRLRDLNDRIDMDDLSGKMDATMSITTYMKLDQRIFERIENEDGSTTTKNGRYRTLDSFEVSDFDGTRIYTKLDTGSPLFSDSAINGSTIDISANRVLYHKNSLQTLMGTNYPFVKYSITENRSISLVDTPWLDYTESIILNKSTVSSTNRIGVQMNKYLRFEDSVQEADYTFFGYEKNSGSNGSPSCYDLYYYTVFYDVNTFTVTRLTRKLVTRIFCRYVDSENIDLGICEDLKNYNVGLLPFTYQNLEDSQVKALRYGIYYNKDVDDISDNGYSKAYFICGKDDLSSNIGYTDTDTGTFKVLSDPAYNYSTKEGANFSLTLENGRFLYYIVPREGNNGKIESYSWSNPIRVYNMSQSSLNKKFAARDYEEEIEDPNVKKETSYKEVVLATTFKNDTTFSNPCIYPEWKGLRLWINPYLNYTNNSASPILHKTVDTKVESVKVEGPSATTSLMNLAVERNLSKYSSSISMNKVSYYATVTKVEGTGTDEGKVNFGIGNYTKIDSNNTTLSSIAKNSLYESVSVSGDTSDYSIFDGKRRGEPIEKVIESNTKPSTTQTPDSTESSGTVVEVKTTTYEDVYNRSDVWYDKYTTMSIHMGRDYRGSIPWGSLGNSSVHNILKRDSIKYSIREFYEVTGIPSSMKDMTLCMCIRPDFELMFPSDAEPTVKVSLVEFRGITVSIGMSSTNGYSLYINSTEFLSNLPTDTNIRFSLRLIFSGTSCRFIVAHKSILNEEVSNTVDCSEAVDSDTMYLFRCLTGDPDSLQEVPPFYGDLYDFRVYDSSCFSKTVSTTDSSGNTSESTVIDNNQVKVLSEGTVREHFSYSPDLYKLAYTIYRDPGAIKFYSNNFSTVDKFGDFNTIRVFGRGTYDSILIDTYPNEPSDNNVYDDSIDTDIYSFTVSNDEIISEMKAIQQELVISAEVYNNRELITGEENYKNTVNYFNRSYPIKEGDIVSIVNTTLYPVFYSKVLMNSESLIELSEPSEGDDGLYTMSGSLLKPMVYLPIHPKDGTLKYSVDLDFNFTLPTQFDFSTSCELGNNVRVSYNDKLDGTVIDLIDEYTSDTASNYVSIPISIPNQKNIPAANMGKLDRFTLKGIKLGGIFNKLLNSTSYYSEVGIPYAETSSTGGVYYTKKWDALRYLKEGNYYVTCKYPLQLTQFTDYDYNIDTKTNYAVLYGTVRFKVEVTGSPKSYGDITYNNFSSDHRKSNIEASVKNGTFTSSPVDNANFPHRKITIRLYVMDASEYTSDSDYTFKWNLIASNVPSDAVNGVKLLEKTSTGYLDTTITADIPMFLSKNYTLPFFISKWTTTGTGATTTTSISTSHDLIRPIQVYPIRDNLYKSDGYSLIGNMEKLSCVSDESELDELTLVVGRTYELIMDFNGRITELSFTKETFTGDTIGSSELENYSRMYSLLGSDNSVCIDDSEVSYNSGFDWCKNLPSMYLKNVRGGFSTSLTTDGKYDNVGFTNPDTATQYYSLGNPYSVSSEANGLVALGKNYAESIQNLKYIPYVNKNLTDVKSELHASYLTELPALDDDSSGRISRIPFKEKDVLDYVWENTFSTIRQGLTSAMSDASGAISQFSKIGFSIGWGTYTNVSSKEYSLPSDDYALYSYQKAQRSMPMGNNNVVISRRSLFGNNILKSQDYTDTKYWHMYNQNIKSSGYRDDSSRGRSTFMVELDTTKTAQINLLYNNVASSTVRNGKLELATNLKVFNVSPSDKTYQPTLQPIYHPIDGTAVSRYFTAMGISTDNITKDGVSVDDNCHLNLSDYFDLSRIDFIDLKKNPPELDDETDSNGNEVKYVNPKVKTYVKVTEDTKYFAKAEHYLWVAKGTTSGKYLYKGDTMPTVTNIVSGVGGYFYAGGLDFYITFEATSNSVRRVYGQRIPFESDKNRKDVVIFCTSTDTTPPSAEGYTFEKIYDTELTVFGIAGDTGNASSNLDDHRLTGGYSYNNAPSGVSTVKGNKTGKDGYDIYSSYVINSDGTLDPVLDSLIYGKNYLSDFSIYSELDGEQKVSNDLFDVSVSYNTVFISDSTNYSRYIMSTTSYDGSMACNTATSKLNTDNNGYANYSARALTNRISSGVLIHIEVKPKTSKVNELLSTGKYYLAIGKTFMRLPKDEEHKLGFSSFIKNPSGTANNNNTFVIPAHKRVVFRGNYFGGELVPLSFYPLVTKTNNNVVVTKASESTQSTFINNYKLENSKKYEGFEVLYKPWITRLVYDETDTDEEGNPNVTIYQYGRESDSLDENKLIRYLTSLSDTSMYSGFDSIQKNEDDFSFGLSLGPVTVRTTANRELRQLNTTLRMESIELNDERISGITNVFNLDKVRLGKESLVGVTNFQFLKSNTPVFELEYLPVIYNETKNHVSLNLMFHRVRFEEGEFATSPHTNVF